MVSSVKQLMTSELDARRTLNALLINYAYDVVIDMTDSKHAPDAQMSSLEKQYLIELENQMESGADIVMLAPSKLLRSPPSEKVRIHLPHYLHRPSKQYKSYDIPWDLIEEDSVKRSLYNAYKFVYIEMECSECNQRLLIPYMMPRELSCIVEGMYEYISLPQHFCLETGWVATIKRARSIMPIRHPWGNPARKKCQWSEVWKATDVVYEPFNCKVGTTNPKQEGVVQRAYQFDTKIEGLTLPMMFPTQMKQGYSGVIPMLEVAFSSFHPGGDLAVEVSFDVADIMAATYICTDLHSAFHYHHSIHLPIHLKGFKLGDVTMTNNARDDLFTVGSYPYGKP